MNADIRANAFDAAVGYKQVEVALTYAVGYTALDVGCGPGHYSHLMAPKFRQLVLIDPDPQNVAAARLQAAEFRHVWVQQDTGEDFHEGHFDTIFLTNVLEHVADPLAVLRNLRERLAPEGRLLIQVPNGQALNRQLGYLLGLIPEPEYLSPEEQVTYGHRRVYTAASLGDDITAADLCLETLTGVVLKPLTNAQMQRVIPDQQVVPFVDALYELGRQHCQWCANLLAVVRHET